MNAIRRLERALQRAVALAEVPDCPPLLAAAMRHAVFPGGARLRPRLCLAVSEACGNDRPEVADAAAAAIELLHCASLIHDDLPCFDDADLRRGKPSVHKAYGEPLAVLAGDALIVLAFQALALGAAAVPRRLATLIQTVGGSVGVPCGIVAGQAWECEPDAEIVRYQRQKTGALFAAATVAGAAAAGVECEAWRVLGERLGLAYQVADDLRDMLASEETLGKPVGRDAALGRPNVAAQLGVDGAVRRLSDLAAEAVASIPACPGAADLRALILSETRRLVPKQLAQSAA